MTYTKWNMKLMYDYCKDKKYDLPKEGQKYTNTKSNYIYICNNHGEYKQSWGKHKEGKSGCVQCVNAKRSSEMKKKTPIQYYSECKQRGYDLPIEEYKRAHTKIKHKCSKCGNVYKQTPSNHLRGQGCPKCNESPGEKYIRNYLDMNNIKYEPQKKFNDLKDKNLLSYDFYLPKQNVLIEYQGQQHYEECSYFGGEERFKIQQYHDKLKREYSKKHGYTLLEPTYKLDIQDKVNDYLDKHLNN